MTCITLERSWTLFRASSPLDDQLSARVKTAVQRNGPNCRFLARTLADNVQWPPPAGDVLMTLTVLDASVKVIVALSLT